jgi:hypothetical protein
VICLRAVLWCVCVYAMVGVGGRECTIRIMMDMFDNVWGDRSEVVVDHCVDITLQVRVL